MAEADALVAGVGEIGEPIAQVLEKAWRVARLDVDLEPDVERAKYLHVCYPFQIDDFVGTTKTYAERYSPSALIVHSTVLPGTSDWLQEEIAQPVFYSPVRGKHRDMLNDLVRYKKFLAGPESRIDEVGEHMMQAGFQVEKMIGTKALEVAKLLETTYFGVLIAWAQETERYAKAVGADYQTVNRFIEEIDFLPDNYHPGYIGGHCVMPNIELLQELRRSAVLDFVQASNDQFSQEAD